MRIFILSLALGTMFFGLRGFVIATEWPNQGRPVPHLLDYMNSLPSSVEARAVARGKLNRSGIEMENPELGEAFEWFSIQDHKFLVKEQIEDMSNLYEPMGLWTFPVIKKGIADFFLTTHYKRGQWLTHLVADPLYGRNLKEIADAWPRSEGFDFKLVHASILGISLIEISRFGVTLGFIRIDKGVEDLNPASLREPNEMVVEIQNIVKGFSEGRRGR